MSYRNTKGISSILPLLAILLLAAAVLGYLSHLNERIAQLEQKIDQTPGNQVAISNDSVSGERGAASGIAAGEGPIEKIISPDDSVAVSGEVIRVDEKAIVISMDPDNDDYNYIANIDKKTTINKQKGATDQTAVPAEISDIKIGDIAIIESDGQINDNNEFTARKINFFEIPEDQPQN